MPEQNPAVRQRDAPLTTLPPEHRPNVENLVTEDDTPVDNIFSEKQQRLLTEPLYSSWEGPGEGRPFLALANVGLFYAVNEPPLVPDVLLSLDVEAPEDLWPKAHRSYFVWEYGKLPEVVIEIVSNREGGETDHKMRLYAHIGIPYYVIYDPFEQIQKSLLRAYRLVAPHTYTETGPAVLEGVGLGLTLWEGEFENMQDRWLRWQDEAGTLIPTGAERAEQERQRAAQAEQRAEQERDRAERLAAQLRALGVEPEDS